MPDLVDSGKTGVNSRVVFIAWGITVPLAVAPDVNSAGAFSIRVVLAALLFPALIPFLWQTARPLRMYAGMLALHTLLAVFFWNALPVWMSRQAWFADLSGYAASFIMQSLKLVAAFVMMGVLAFLGYQRREFFMPTMQRGTWMIPSGVVAAVVVGLMLVVPAEIIRHLLLALLLAAINSFAEEMLYRGALLAPLLRHVAPNQAISMTAVLFGIAHYHGTPSGFPGMLLTFIAGWVFGLAMVETRSILLPWFLHFVPDAVIFITGALQK